jgi:hypothetical protein
MFSLPSTHRYRCCTFVPCGVDRFFFGFLPHHSVPVVLVSSIRRYLRRLGLLCRRLRRLGLRRRRLRRSTGLSFARPTVCVTWLRRRRPDLPPDPCP